MKLTRVIKINGRQRDQFLADPDFVYVGRRFAGFEGSKWGNPFNSKGSGMTLGEVLDRYDRHIDECLESCPELYDLGELAGKTLGCWCGDWEPDQPEIPCHACRLARRVNAAIRLSESAGD